MAKKRTALSLPLEFDTKLSKLAEYEGIPKATLIVNFLSQLEPHVDLMLQGHSALEQGKSPSKIIDTLMGNSIDQLAIATNELNAINKLHLENKNNEDD